MSNEVELAKRTAYNSDVKEKLGDSIKLPSTRLPKFVQQDWDAEPYDDDEVNKLLKPCCNRRGIQPIPRDLGSIKSYLPKIRTRLSV